ncbi:MAG: FAD-dependent oxidoreductase, partial [Deltaproteobacteria bacterium]
MYDVAVIGAGWAGFTAAREAFLLGRKVCLIEKNLIGGTCLNAGCIPTKTLVQSAKTLDRTKKALNFGITTGPVSFDMPVVQQRKEKVMSLLRRGMESRLSGIDLIREEARLLTDRTIKAGERTIEASCVIVCSGSCPRPLKGFEFDGSKILSSDDALKLVSAPSSLLASAKGSTARRAAGSHGTGASRRVARAAGRRSSWSCRSCSSWNCSLPGVVSSAGRRAGPGRG